MHLCLRIAHLMLGSARGASSFSGIRDRVTKQLAGLSLDVDAVVDSIASTVANLESSDAEGKRNLNSISHTCRTNLFHAQQHRCAVCGWSFRTQSSRVRAPHDCLPTIDHKVAHRIGGDRSDNLWILCSLCNRQKHAYTHVADDGVLWSNNTAYPPSHRALAFWVLYRDKHCQHGGCKNGPINHHMHVSRRAGAGPWAYDNCEALCPIHANGKTSIDY